MRTLIDSFNKFYHSDKFVTTYRYVIIGLITTAISYGSFRILYHNMNINYNIANTLSILLAILFSYVASKLYVFQTHCETREELYREMFTFYSSRFFAMIVEIGSVFVFHGIFFIDEMLSKLLAGGLIFVINYITSRFIIFKN